MQIIRHLHSTNERGRRFLACEMPRGGHFFHARRTGSTAAGKVCYFRRNFHSDPQQILTMPTNRSTANPPSSDANVSSDNNHFLSAQHRIEKGGKERKNPKQTRAHPNPSMQNCRRDDRAVFTGSTQRAADRRCCTSWLLHGMDAALPFRLLVQLLFSQAGMTVSA